MTPEATASGFIDVVERFLEPDAGDDVLAAACLANTGAIGAALAGRTPGAEADRRESLDRHRGPAEGGLWNAVTRTTVPADEADGLIDETLTWFGDRICRWWIGPTDEPSDLVDRLVAHGFDGSPVPGMVCELGGAWDPPRPMPPDIEVRRVRSRDEADDFLVVLSACYPGETGWQGSWGDAFAAIGFNERSPVRVFVGRSGGEPVAASFLVMGAGVAGVYGVHTVPHRRGAGLGAELTRVPMRAAREEGYRVAVLQANPLAAPLYERIGFRTICQVGLYEREPAAAG